MAAFKQFNSQDIIVSPLEVNKSFTFEGQDILTLANVEIDRFLGKNVNYTGSTITGYITARKDSSIYNSAKELYYSNFLSQSFGDPLTTASFNPDGTITGGVHSPLYYNYLQSTLTASRFFPTGSNSTIAVFSIPSKLYGDYIQPNSFKWVDNDQSVTITDDGEGNLLSGSTNIGNIIYPHGIAIITKQTIGGSTTPTNLINSSNVTCSFSSSYELFETQYKCTLTEDEFNYTLNPSITSGSNGKTYDFATGSYFSPYVTTVGMYDENFELLAVGKLAKPLPTSRTTDTTILINIDRQ